MKIIGKRTQQYGLYKPNSKDIKKFDDSELFEEKLHKGTLLKSVKIYFSKNKTLFGIESSFVNIINGQKKLNIYHGGDKDINPKELEMQELKMRTGEYISDFFIGLDNEFEIIKYVKIMTNKKNEIEFGENDQKKVTTITDKEDNMIQYFFGEYEKDRIINIGYAYINKKNFVFHTIFPILKLRYKINHDKEFKEKYETNYKSLLKDNLPMMYLYRTCTLPETMFAKILKYC